MALIATLDDARLVAWACFLIGAAVLVAGLVIGFRSSAGRAESTATERLAKAQSELQAAETRLATAQEGIRAEAEGLELPGGVTVTDEVDAAAESTGAAKSALEQVQGLVGALPEHLRFAGMLVLVGTVLMSVATVQFGGISLF